MSRKKIYRGTPMVRSEEDLCRDACESRAQGSGLPFLPAMTAMDIFATLDQERDRVKQLQEENARLKELLATSFHAAVDD